MPAAGLHSWARFFSRAPGLLCALACLAPAPALARKPLIVPLDVVLARCRGADNKLRPVKPDKWVAAHVAAANRVLRSHKVALTARVRAVVLARCDLLTRAHRHAMAVHVRPGAHVTVMVLRRVRDLDVPDYDLMGVHWRYRGKDPALAGRRWLLLTARARPPVLAHELGHFFGLRHDPAGGNLMTPGPSSPLWRRKVKPKPFQPRLTRGQGRRIRRAARRLLKR